MMLSDLNVPLLPHMTVHRYGDGDDDDRYSRTGLYWS